MAAAWVVELWLLPQLASAGPQWMHGSLVLPLMLLLGGLVWTTRFQHVAPPLAALVVGLSGASTTASLVWVDDPGPVLMVLAAVAVALPSVGGVGIALGGTLAVGMFAGGLALVIESGGVQHVAALATAWAGAVTIGILLGLYRERTERSDLLAKAELQEARSALMWQVHTDRLTGLPNRGYVQEWLERTCERARRGGSDVAVLVVDIDRFKSINDVYGHAVGDDVIRCVGRALMRSSGPTDLVGRWGGEEFVVVLEGCDRDQVTVVAETMRRAVASSRVMADGEEVQMTVSIGIATWDRAEHIGPAELFVRADRALYVAKGDGRNRVHTHTVRPA